MASLKEQVGHLVRHHRRRRGLTQVELADRSKLSVEMVNRVERGVTAPSLATLATFAAVLGTPVGEFFSAGGYNAEAGRADPLVRLINRVAGLDSADLDWVDRLVATALNRKVRKPAAPK